jgi:hypothetical protein
MNIPETFYIALCVTILMLGIVYWFWTQVQYLQRKVNLLDNVVYEMKTFISNLPGTETRAGNTFEPQPPKAQESHNYNKEESPVPTVYNPPPESVAGDLEAERLASEIEFEPFSGENNSSEPVINAVETVYSEPPEESSYSQQNDDSDVNDDLQPGGLASVSSSNNTKKVEVFSDSSLESPLSSMSIKELRRMAEANNIPGSAELRKKELIKALRDKVGQIIGNGSDMQKEKEHVLSFDDIGAPGSE